MADTPKPGDTIVPAGAPRPAEQRVTALDVPPQTPVQAPAPPVPIPAPQPVALPETSVEPVPSPQLQPLPPVQPPVPDHEITESDGVISWTASEFVSHEKSSSWYAGLAAAALFGAALVYLLTKDFVSSGVIIFSAVIFGFYGARQPRQLQYQLGSNGFSVGDKHYAYEEFRSFTVASEGAFSSIVFTPLKRFGTLTTIYYAPEDEDRIVAVLLDRLPFEEHSPDAVDRLMNRIRF